MDLHFEAGRADAYISGLQRARVLTEHWVAGQLYCPNCGNLEIIRYVTTTRLAISIALCARKNTS